jgi:hypothetical protein
MTGSTGSECSGPAVAEIGTKLSAAATSIAIEASKLALGILLPLGQGDPLHGFEYNDHARLQRLLAPLSPRLRRQGCQRLIRLHCLLRCTIPHMAQRGERRDARNDGCDRGSSRRRLNIGQPALLTRCRPGRHAPFAVQHWQSAFRELATAGITRRKARPEHFFAWTLKLYCRCLVPQRAMEVPSLLTPIHSE